MNAKQPSTQVDQYPDATRRHDMKTKHFRFGDYVFLHISLFLI